MRVTGEFPNVTKPTDSVCIFLSSQGKEKEDIVSMKKEDIVSMKKTLQIYIG